MGTQSSRHNPNLLSARIVRETRATATVEAHLRRHALEVTAREAKRRAEDVKSARDLADLERRLGGALGRADKAEAKIGALTEALSESRSDLRRKVASLRRTIGTGEERLREIQDAKASSSSASSSATTYTEDEVEEMETVMGDLTAQLAEVNKLRKHDEAKYDRTRQAVAGFRLKYLASSESSESRATFTGPAPNGGAR